MVGGFLGAGKTTTLARLATHYTQRGLKVGVVTNDQADDLVDTRSLRAQGFEVGEVAGACFCCQFDSLISTMESLSVDQRPDVILAEPVGSCTDLVATVIQPLRQLFDVEFSIAPYSVILKPSHGRRILRNEAGSGFSPKAAYILKKQLEEADLVLLNRCDELTAEEISELQTLVRDHVGDRPVLKVSAKTGAGFEELTQWLDQEGDFGRHILDIDYDTYAEGEAELGWLNSSVHITCEQPFSLDELLTEVISKLQQQLAEASAEAAHLKAIGLWEGFFGVANLISSDSAPELSLPSHCDVESVDVIVNARAACDPDALQSMVEEVVSSAVRRRSGTADFRKTQSFRPGRPVPTHRFAEAR